MRRVPPDEARTGTFVETFLKDEHDGCLAMGRKLTKVMALNRVTDKELVYTLIGSKHRKGDTWQIYIVDKPYERSSVLTTE